METAFFSGYQSTLYSFNWSHWGCSLFQAGVGSDGLDSRNFLRSCFWVPMGPDIWGLFAYRRLFNTLEIVATLYHGFERKNWKTVSIVQKPPLKFITIYLLTSNHRHCRLSSSAYSRNANHLSQGHFESCSYPPHLPRSACQCPRRSCPLHNLPAWSGAPQREL